MGDYAVLHLNDRLSQRGGADVHMLGVIGAQIERHRVALAVGYADGSVEAPCPVHVVPGLASRVARSCSLGPLLDRVRPDVVHIHNVVNPAVLEQAAAWPAVMTVQDHRAFCPGRGKLTASGQVCTTPMARDTCAGCFDDPAYFDHILALTKRRLVALSRLTLVVLSQYMKRELVATGVVPSRVHVIPPFAWGIEDLGAGNQPECVLFCGRLVGAKGVLDAVHAWRLSGIDLPLVIAGTGPLRTGVEEQCRGCRLTGWVPHDRLGGWYRAARVVIMPSRWQEPFGITGLEALTMGVPVAAWASGGVAEWYRGPPLLEWGDVEGLAGAIRNLVGTTARAPEGFSRDALMARLDALYARTRA